MSTETHVVAYQLPDGTLYELRNLPWGVVVDIEQKTGASWIVVVDMPHANGAALVATVTAIHDEVGIDPPVVRTAADAAELIGRLVLVDAQTGEPVVSEEVDAARAA